MFYEWFLVWPEYFIELSALSSASWSSIVRGLSSATLSVLLAAPLSALLKVTNRLRPFHIDISGDRYRPKGFTEEANIIQTTRGGVRLIDSNGFIYRTRGKGVTHNRVFWVCSLVNNPRLKCNARGITVNDKIARFTGVHTHTAESYDYSRM